jgi:hypothetical protein
MARRPGTVLTERDIRLFGYLAVAHYLSAEQVQRLVVDHASPQVTYRRLRRLCQASRHGIDQPYLRRYDFRRPDGANFPIWGLSPLGWAEAEKVVPYVTQPRTPRELGWQFLQHQILLTEILVGLIRALRKAPHAPIIDLPFRWFSEPEDQLVFSLYDSRAGLMTPAALRPDAILEAPGISRRFFIEAETGSHSITTASPLNYGAVLGKLQRYAAYFTGFVGKGTDTTWYSRAFPDRMFPELVFVVHAAGRRERVEGAVKKYLGDARPMEPFALRVMTFREAPDVFSALLSGAPVPRSRILTIDEEKALRIRDGYNALVSALNAMVKTVAEHNHSHPELRVPLPAVSRETVVGMAELIKHDLLGEAGGPAKWSAKLIDSRTRTTAAGRTS